jgi:hypothetical protein
MLRLSPREKLLKFRKITSTGCWEWQGGKSDAYGVMRIGGRAYKVHRVSAKEFMGLDLLSSYVVLHKCDNGICFNPEHLQIGTQRDNVLDSFNKGRRRYGSGGV